MLAPLNPRERLRVARQCRQAKVRPECLGNRARRRPALATGTVLCSGTACHGAEVVILDHERPRGIGQHCAQLGSTDLVESSSCRVLPAWRDHDRARAPLERDTQVSRTHARVVDRDRLEREAASAQQVEQGRVARVLDGDAIAGV